MLICAILCTAIPIGAMIIIKVKNKEVKLSSFFIGSGVFIIFALILEQLLHSVMLPLISGSTAAYVIYGTLAAGVFEESGRFIAFKTVLKKADRKNAVMFGLGHGGTEAIILVGLTMFSYAATAVMTNSLGLEKMAELSSAGNAETAELLRIQLEALSSFGIANVLLNTLERLLAITFHTAASVMVFEAARVREKRFLYPLCILLHALLNVPAALYQRGVLTMGMIYPIMIVITAAVVFLAVRSYRRTAAVSAEVTADGR